MVRNLYEFDRDSIIACAESSTNVTEMLTTLGYNQYNTRYRKALTSFMVSEGIPIPTGRRVKTSPTRTLGELLVYSDVPPANTSSLKRRLIQEGLLEERCATPGCGVEGTWLGKKITLHLDHIDGDRRNNLLVNLRLLCPNCHSQTSTYTGRNIRLSNILNSGLTEDILMRWLSVASLTDISKTNGCSISTLRTILGDSYDPNYLRKRAAATDDYNPNVEFDISGLPEGVASHYDLAVLLGISAVALRKIISERGNLADFNLDPSIVCTCGILKSKGCAECEACAKVTARKNTVISWPSSEEILNGISQSGYEAYSKSLGVSSTAVRKHLKRKGITPPRIYKLKAFDN